jgi:hypothetical protein
MSPLEGQLSFAGSPMKLRWRFGERKISEGMGERWRGKVVTVSEISEFLLHSSHEGL